MTDLEKYIVMRDITRDECKWLDFEVPEGTIVYARLDTYKVCTKKGKAVSLTTDLETRYFELPKNALKRYQGYVFFNN
jgi:hypothetical protein